MGEKLLGKIIISGRLQCLTGIHIGASNENMEIGAIDSPVVRDPITREPYIPGSSLKGKLRALLEKAHAKIPNREIGSDVKIHVCNDSKDAFDCEVCRMFGSTKGKGENLNNFPSRLIVRDLALEPGSRERLSDIDTGLQYTEWKFENAIDRVSAAANPRQIERVPKSAEFIFELIYNVEEALHVEIDLKNLNLAIELLKLDSLGGHGSRGYGKVNILVPSIKAMTVNNLRGVAATEVAECNSLVATQKIVALFTHNKSQDQQ